MSRLGKLGIGVGPIRKKGLPARPPREKLERKKTLEEPKRGVIRKGIESLEKLEGGDFRTGTSKFPRGVFVVISKGPHKGKSGLVVGSRVEKLGAKTTVFIKVGAGKSPGSGAEILVNPRHLVRAAGV